MTNELLEQLLHETESPYLDFKRDQYRFVSSTDEEKAELLKDILAFANAWRRTDAFILIGVEEVKGERSIVRGVTWHFDDASLQQFVNSKTQRAIDFSVLTVGIDQQKIDVIRIPVQGRPFYLKKDYAKLKAGVVYFRRGTTTAEANPDEIAAMGKDAAESKALEPELHLQFAAPEYAWLGKPSFKELGTKLEFLLQPLDPLLLYRGTDPNPWFKGVHGHSTRTRESPNEIERNARLMGMTKSLRFAVTNRGPVSALNVEAHLAIPKASGLVLATYEQMHPFAIIGIPELQEQHR
jgi:hypothetical protein